MPSIISKARDEIKKLAMAEKKKETICSCGMNIK